MSDMALIVISVLTGFNLMTSIYSIQYMRGDKK